VEVNHENPSAPPPEKKELLLLIPGDWALQATDEDLEVLAEIPMELCFGYPELHTQLKADSFSI
jgi:hypothetical protein